MASQAEERPGEAAAESVAVRSPALEGARCSRSARTSARRRGSRVLSLSPSVFHRKGLPTFGNRAVGRFTMRSVTVSGWMQQTLGVGALVTSVGWCAIACSGSSSRAPADDASVDARAAEAGGDVAEMADMTVADEPDAVSDEPDAVVDDGGPDVNVTTNADATTADADASPYVAKAPHCVRDADAAALAPFDPGPDASFAITALPQVVPGGGSVLHLPTFVSVTYPNDPMADELDDFVASVGCTPYWHAIADDYGVGDAVAATPVRFLTNPGSLMMDDTALRAGLAADIEGGALPRPSQDTVYVLWYPAGSGFGLSIRGAHSCADFFGYHEAGTLNDGTRFAYAVVPECAGSTIDDLTASASHELIESCTDPLQDTAPAYAYTDSNHPGGAFVYGTEVADLCILTPHFQPAGFPWQIQRSWSNRSAWLGQDPCAPAPSTDYYYAAPIVGDTMTTSLLTGDAATVAAVHVSVGTSRTIPLQVMANFDAGPLALHPFAPLSPGLSFSVSPPTGMPGDVVMLTISKDGGDATNGGEGFMIVTFPQADASTAATTYYYAVTSD